MPCAKHAKPGKLRHAVSKFVCSAITDMTVSIFTNQRHEFHMLK